jgi:hypothetical protein
LLLWLLLLQRLLSDFLLSFVLPAFWIEKLELAVEGSRRLGPLVLLSDSIEDCVATLGPAKEADTAEAGQERGQDREAGRRESVGCKTTTKIKVSNAVVSSYFLISI